MLYLVTSGFLDHVRLNFGQVLKRAAMVLAVPVLLVACAKPPPPVITTVQFALTTAADTNPDARKRASPVTVRVFALKSAATFEAADFFSLYEKDAATLGADVVQREEFLMTPSQQKTLAMKLGPEVKAIAVMVAFRDLERARWRAVQVLDVGKTVDLTAALAGSQVSLQYKVQPEK
jgi:type VI secretion system protein VasD